MTAMPAAVGAPSPRSRHGIHRVRWVLAWVATLLVAAGWFTMLRPTVWGGPISYIVIRGTSMLPTYQPGDLVLVLAAEEYGPGDVVAYRVPEGDFGAGMILIHRVIGGSAEEGFVLLGDNNDEEDEWNPREAEVVGRPVAYVPAAGKVLTTLRNPLVLASLAAGVAVAMVAVPNPRSKPVGRATGRHLRRRRMWGLDLSRPRGAHVA